MVNIFITILICLNTKYSVRPAAKADIGQIVDMLQKEHSMRFLAPEMNRDIFLRNLEKRPHFGLVNYIVAQTRNSIIGVCSAWDMTPFKKNRILVYGKTLRRTKWLYNAMVAILGMPPLPKAGDSLKDITITEYAVKDRDPAILDAMLRYVYMQYRGRGYHSIIFARILVLMIRC